MSYVIIPRNRTASGMRPTGIPVLNRDHFFSDGLKGWWPVISGNTSYMPSILKDFSGHNYDLIQQGKERKPLQHPSLGKGIIYPNANADTGSIYWIEHNLGITEFPYTMAVWAQPTRLSRFDAILGFSDSGSTSAHGIRTSNTDLWQQQWGGSTSSSNSTFDFNNPSHVLVSNEHSTRKELWVGGEIQSAITSSLVFGTKNRFGVGGMVDSTPSNVWEGYFWEAAIWNRKLTEDEIFNLWNPITRWSHYRQPKSYVPVDFPSSAAAQDIEGSILIDADTLNDGLITVNIAGSILTDVDTLNHGLVNLATLEGSLLEDADTLNHGFINIDVVGQLLEEVDTLNHGLITYFIYGSPLIDTDTLNHGLMEPLDISGSLLEDAEDFTLNDGDIVLQLQQIFNSTLEDDDTINDGLVNLGTLEGSILTDADTLNHGQITLNIKNSFLTDADTLSHGDLNLNISGSLLEDSDSFNQGENSGGVVDANISASILTDTDTFNQGGISVQLFGSSLQDSDILGQGTLFSLISGSLLTDTDDLNNGIMGNSKIEGSLFQDGDNIYGSLVQDDVEPFYKITNVFPIIGGDFVDLVDEAVFLSAMGTIIGKHEVTKNVDSV